MPLEYRYPEFFKSKTVNANLGHPVRLRLNDTGKFVFPSRKSDFKREIIYIYVAYPLDLNAKTDNNLLTFR